MTHDLTRTILTTVQNGAPVASMMIGMVGAFVPGITGQVLASSVGLVGLLGVGAKRALAQIGNSEAVVKSIERGPPVADTSISDAKESTVGIDHGPSADLGPPEAEQDEPELGM